MSSASVLADVFRPIQPPIHATHLHYTVASFCDLEFHLRLDRDPRRIGSGKICRTIPG